MGHTTLIPSSQNVFIFICMCVCIYVCSMYVCIYGMYVCMYVCIYVCMYLYFCCRNLRIYKQNLLRILFRRSSFLIGNYSEIYQKHFRKIISRKSICKVGSSESIKRILEKYLQRNLHFRKLFCIYEQNLWNTHVKEFSFSVYHTPAGL